MRIIALRAENVKRIKAVEIKPDGDVVVIAGRNAQGKSSVLDAIWMALAGGSGAKETSRPIRDGETKASVVLDLGDLLVTRRWTQAGTTLEVASTDNEGAVKAKFSSPQAVLDGLIGRLTFDPFAFAEASARDQLAMLLEVVKLPFDPDEVAADRQAKFDTRTEVNRDVKRLAAQLEGVEAPPPDTPDEEQSAAAIASELRNAEEEGRQHVAAQDRERVANAEVVELEAKLRTAQVERVAAQKALAALKPPDDQLVFELRGRLEKIDAINEAVRAKRARARLEADLAEKQAESKRLTTDIEEIDATKADALAATKMPLDGLGFDEEGVLYGGVPFAQASASERLRASVAIAMALNPRIRVLRITDGSLLDSENLALIESMAGEHDFQVWLERVDESGKVGVVIEDGQVKG